MDARDLTFEEAARLFSYDPATGVLTRIACADISKIGPCTATKRGYIYVRARGAKYLGHRIAWLLHYGHWPDGQLDHRNRIRSDNRIDNLRESDDSINNHNKTAPQKNSTTGVRGVSIKHGKFCAQITANGKRQHIGLFETIEDAETAYIDAKKRLHVGYIG